MQGLLKKIQEQLTKKNISLTHSFEDAARGAPYIRDTDFFDVIERKCSRLSNYERDDLIAVYETQYNSKKIDYMQFLQDLKNVQDDLKYSTALTQD